MSYNFPYIKTDIILFKQLKRQGGFSSPLSHPVNVHPTLLPPQEITMGGKSTDGGASKATNHNTISGFFYDVDEII